MVSLCNHNLYFPERIRLSIFHLFISYLAIPYVNRLFQSLFSPIKKNELYLSFSLFGRNSLYIVCTLIYYIFLIICVAEIYHFFACLFLLLLHVLMNKAILIQPSLLLLFMVNDFLKISSQEVFDYLDFLKIFQCINFQKLYYFTFQIQIKKTFQINQFESI